jgi:hypothetical protein
MAINRQGKQPEDGDIDRPRPTEDRFKRKDRLATVFGWGKFGVGRFSRKKIVREKNL